jgi:hypothetical protein
LSADQVTIAAAGAMGHPDIPQRGVVPGLSDWEYFFHGCGCCLTHRLTGESIDVDFHDSTADWFDCFFYINYLRSLKDPPFVEERLTALHRSYRTIVLARDELLDLGLLEPFKGSKTVRLSFDDEELRDLLNDIEPKWQDVPTQLALGAAVGDWFLVDNLNTEVLSKNVRENLTVCRDQRSSDLDNMFRRGTNQPEALRALQELDSPKLPAMLSEVMRAKSSGTTSVALEVIDEQDDAAWCDEVHALMNHVDPNGAIPQPHVWHKCAQFLLRHGQTSDIKQQLRRINSNCLGDASILALEYVPDIALETFRRALRSKIPCNRIASAAALAIIDQPWSRKELIAVISESRDHVMTSECRSALMTTHSQECHRIVLDWERRNPRQPEQGPFITMDEMTLRMSDGTIHWEMEKLHDRVMKLRSTVPARPKRPWWRLRD